MIQKAAFKIHQKESSYKSKSYKEEKNKRSLSEFPLTKNKTLIKYVKPLAPVNILKTSSTPTNTKKFLHNS